MDQKAEQKPVDVPIESKDLRCDHCAVLMDATTYGRCDICYFKVCSMTCLFAHKYAVHPGTVLPGNDSDESDTN